MNAKIKIIESREVERDYCFRGQEIIVDHPDYGRMLIMDGFGGKDELSGGAVRWRHGMAITLRDEDTFASLSIEDGIGLSEYDYAIQGHGELIGLLVLELPGSVIESIAEEAE